MLSFTLESQSFESCRLKRGNFSGNICQYILPLKEIFIICRWYPKMANLISYLTVLTGKKNLYAFYKCPGIFFTLLHLPCIFIICLNNHMIVIKFLFLYALSV